MDIQIGTSGVVRVQRSDEWVILYCDDGSNAKTTISLTPRQAFDVAQLLKGAGVTAAHTRPRITAKDTPLRIADVECPSCRARRDNCRLCGGSGVVTEQQARDWPEAG